MKNSSLYRANLSRQKISLLKELSEKKSNVSYDSASPSVYVRPNKEQELDALWTSFKVSDKQDKSPGVYLLVGFVAGALAMFLMTALLSFIAGSAENNSSLDKIKHSKPVAKSELTIIPSDTKATEPVSQPVKENYTVKSGDSLEGISLRFYGRYDSAKIQKLMQANGLTNPNALQIGQKLVIPMN